MEVVGTSVNMGDGGGSRADIDTSSSIGSVSSPSANENYTISTSAYQTNNTGNTYDIEEVDLSLEEEASTPETTQQVEEPKKGLFSRIGDWFVNAGKKIYETGAKVVSDIKSWCSENLLGPGNNLAETAANVAHNAIAIGGKLGQLAVDGAKKFASTAAVFTTTVTSGVAKLGEHVVDGLAWCGGKIVEGGSWVVGKLAGLFGAKEAEKDIIDWGKQADKDVKEFIAEDWVGKANKEFYENTEVGRWLNENSIMKYDSPAAKKIMEISEKAAEIAAATALTIFTGGAATFAVGALVGVGKQAEKTYQANGTDTTLLQELGIAGSGVLTGFSWMATGKLGKGFINIGKEVAAKGAKHVVSSLAKDIFSREFWKDALREGLTGKNGIGNYISSAMMTGQDLIPYLNGEEKFTPQAFGKLCLVYLKNLGLNVAEDALRGYVGGINGDKMGHYREISAQKAAERAAAKAAKAMGAAALAGDVAEDVTEDLMEHASKIEDVAGDATEKLDEAADALDDLADDASGMTAKAGETLEDAAEGVETTVRRALSDDDALAMAEDILDPSTTTKLSKLEDLTDESAKKVIDCLTGDEIYKGMDEMDDLAKARILSFMDDGQRAKFVEQFGEDILSPGTSLSSKDLFKYGDDMADEVIDSIRAKNIRSTERISKEFKEMEVMSELSKNHPDVKGMDFDTAKKLYGTDVAEITKNNYRRLVIEDKNGYWSDQSAIKYGTQQNYDAKHGAGAFDKLSAAQQTAEIDSFQKINTDDGSLVALRKAYAEHVADATIDQLEQMERTGMLREGVSSDEVLRLIQSDADPKSYLSDKAIQEWESAWGAVDGKAKVYAFQTTEAGCLSSKPQMNGNVGRSEGMFVMSEQDYKKVMQAATLSDGSIDRDLLSKALGGVDVSKGEIVSIEQIVDVKDLQMPRGNLEGSFIGDWVPGGKTSGGSYEALIPQRILDKTQLVIDGSTVTQTISDAIIKIKSITSGIDGAGIVGRLFDR